MTELNKLELLLWSEPLSQRELSSFACHPSPKNNHIKVNISHNMVVILP